MRVEEVQGKTVIAGHWMCYEPSTSVGSSLLESGSAIWEELHCPLFSVSPVSAFKVVLPCLLLSLDISEMSIEKKALFRD
jgi:hypothetical protein